MDRLSLDYDNVQKINLGSLIMVNGALFLPTVRISKRDVDSTPYGWAIVVHQAKVKIENERWNSP